MEKFREEHIEDFVRMSRFAGGRLDLIQAGGGNASVKMENGLMLIKASGCYMGEVSPEQGYTEVRHEILREIISAQACRPERAPKEEIERAAATALSRAAVTGAPRPSIEMFMHAILGKCVLHTHPVTTAAVACRDGWKEILAAKFPDALLVEYHTPGIELATAIFKEIIKRGANPQQQLLVVFLENHGLVVSARDAGEVIETTESVSAALAPVSGIDAGRFKTAAEISERMGADSAGLSCFEATDAYLLQTAASHPEFLFAPPFCPDSVVYNGPAPIKIDDLDNPAPLKSFIHEHGEIPRVIFYRGRIFFIASGGRAARDMEEVLKFHVLVLSASGGNVNSLPEEEIRYLRGWEAEKYRSKI